MICTYFTKQPAYMIICGLVCLFNLAGCTEHNYKKEADEKVYNIIDQKWRIDYGTKANYKISDTTPTPSDIQIEKVVPASGVLSLSEAVALATAHNREYQTNKEELYIKALDLSLTRYEFEKQFFRVVGGGYTADNNDEVLGIEANYGFNQLLASGTRISAKIASAWIDVLSGSLRSGMASLLSVTVIQPLLRGGDRRVVLENLTQAERDTLYEVRSFNRYRKKFVVSVISQYYGVMQRLDAVKNARTNYNTLNRIFGRIENLANAGRIPQFELDRAMQEKLKAFDISLQAEREYKQALDEFKITLSLPTTAEFQLDKNELEALRASEMAKPDFSEAEVIEAALLRRLDMTNNADAVIDAQRKVFVTADALRTELNIIGSADAVSSRRGDRNTLGSLNEEYGLGFELDLPLDRVPEQHVYRKALITLNQRQREYDLAADIVRLEVRQAYRNLDEAAERHKVQLEALELAKTRFNKTYLLLQYSRASSRRVLSAQEDLFDAQNETTQTLVDYTIATLNFYRDTGVLHVRPDGMWER
ncbi:MAG: TolC family protein [Planctomycetes bacterium]|nr:TolC family protein [Planctomycetota bacterium]